MGVFFLNMNENVGDNEITVNMILDPCSDPILDPYFSILFVVG
jgi:hypothetical protein